MITTFSPRRSLIRSPRLTLIMILFAGMLSNLYMCREMLMFRNIGEIKSCVVEDPLNLSSPVSTVASGYSGMHTEVLRVMAVTDVQLQFVVDGVCQFYAIDVNSTLSDGGIYVDVVLDLTKYPQCTTAYIAPLGHMYDGSSLQAVEFVGYVSVTSADDQEVEVAQIALYRDDNTTMDGVNSNIIVAVNEQRQSNTSHILVGQAIAGKTITLLSSSNTRRYAITTGRQMDILLERSVLDNYQQTIDLIELMYNFNTEKFQLAEEKADCGNIFYLDTQNFIPPGDAYNRAIYYNDLYLAVYDEGTLEPTVVCQFGELFDLSTSKCIPEASCQNQIQERLCLKNDKCIFEYYKHGNRCIPYPNSSAGEYINMEDNTIRECSGGEYAQDDGQCVQSCHSGYFGYKEGCHVECPYGTLPSGQTCTEPASLSSCANADLFIEASSEIGMGAMCIHERQCPPYLVLSSDRTCSLGCKNSEVADANTRECVDNCSDGSLLNAYTGLSSWCEAECLTNEIAHGGNECQDAVYDDVGCQDEQFFDRFSKRCQYCGVATYVNWDRAASGNDADKCKETCQYYNLTAYKRNITNNENKKTHYAICEEAGSKYCPVFVEDAEKNLCTVSCAQHELFQESIASKKCVHQCSDLRYKPVQKNVDGSSMEEYLCDSTCQYYYNKTVYDGQTALECTECSQPGEYRHEHTRLCNQRECSEQLDGDAVFTIVENGQPYSCVRFGVTGCKFSNINRICQDSCTGVFYSAAYRMGNGTAITYEICVTDISRCPIGANNVIAYNAIMGAYECLAECPDSTPFDNPNNGHNCTVQCDSQRYKLVTVGSVVLMRCIPVDESCTAFMFNATNQHYQCLPRCPDTHPLYLHQRLLNTDAAEEYNCTNAAENPSACAYYTVRNNGIPECTATCLATEFVEKDNQIDVLYGSVSPAPARRCEDSCDKFTQVTPNKRYIDAEGTKQYCVARCDDISARKYISVDGRCIAFCEFDVQSLDTQEKRCIRDSECREVILYINDTYKICVDDLQCRSFVLVDIGSLQITCVGSCGTGSTLVLLHQNKRFCIASTCEEAEEIQSFRNNEFYNTSNGLTYCVNNCDGMFYALNGTRKQCKQSCTDYTSRDYILVSFSGVDREERKCTNCSQEHGIYIVVDGLRQCLDQDYCPAANEYQYNSECRPEQCSEIPNSAMPFIEYNADEELKVCAARCAESQLVHENTYECSTSCPPTYVYKSLTLFGQPASMCVPNCDEGDVVSMDDEINGVGKCLSSCPNGEYKELDADTGEYGCVAQCKSLFYVSNDSSKECVDACPERLYVKDAETDTLLRCVGACGSRDALLDEGVSGHHRCVSYSDCDDRTMFLMAVDNVQYCSADCGIPHDEVIFYEPLSSYKQCLPNCDGGFAVYVPVFGLTTTWQCTKTQCTGTTRYRYEEEYADGTTYTQCLEKCPTSTFIRTALSLVCLATCQPVLTGVPAYYVDQGINICLNDNKCEDDSETYTIPTEGEVNGYTLCSSRCADDSRPYFDLSCGNDTSIADKTTCCYASCSEGSGNALYQDGRSCVIVCPENKPYAEDGVCVSNCRYELFKENTSVEAGRQGQFCVAECNEFLNVGEEQDMEFYYHVTPETPNRQCLSSCSEVGLQYYDKEYVCVANCSGSYYFGSECVDSCDTTVKPMYYLTPDGRGVCVDTCMSINMFEESEHSNKCVEQCLGAYSIMLIESTEQRCTNRCPENHYRRFGTQKECVDSCADGEVAVRDVMVFDQFQCLDRCPDTSPYYIVDDRMCVDTCGTATPYYDATLEECVAVCSGYHPAVEFGIVCMEACSNYTLQNSSGAFCLTVCPSGYRPHNDECISGDINMIAQQWWLWLTAAIVVVLIIVICVVVLVLKNKAAKKKNMDMNDIYKYSRRIERNQRDRHTVVENSRRMVAQESRMHAAAQERRGQILPTKSQTHTSNTRTTRNSRSGYGSATHISFERSATVDSRLSSAPRTRRGQFQGRIE